LLKPKHPYHRSDHAGRALQIDRCGQLVNFTVPACNIYLRVYSLQALLHTPRALHRHDLSFTNVWSAT